MALGIIMMENIILENGRPADYEGRLDKEKRCYDLLDSLGIEYLRADHPVAETMTACEKIDKALGGEICKNLFLCNKQQTAFYLLLMPGAKPFKTKVLSKQIGSSRLSFATPEHMEALLDITPGSVSILGLMNDKEKALEYFTKAHELKPAQMDTLWFLSRYDLENGDTEAAIDKLEKILESRFSPLNFVTADGVRKELDDKKHHPMDFALWKKASPEHIMRWPSPWSDGFPGWHLECSAMSEKYLGKEFDIHGGGMDLLFPHHECEIAQNTASRGCGGVKYWMHNNMITIEGKKMGKSLGNFITLPELFAGNHAKLDQAYTPMTVRFFILQAHYRGTLDFSNEALQAAEKGLKRIMQAAKDLKTLAAAAGVQAAPALAYGEFVSAVAPSEITASNAEVKALVENVYEALCDDLNTPIALSHIFDAVRIINTAKDKKLTLDSSDYKALTDLFDNVVFGVLGLRDEESEGGKATKTMDGLIQMVLEQRKAAKAAKDWATSDKIRDDLKALGIQIKDGKDGTEWTLE